MKTEKEITDKIIKYNKDIEEIKDFANDPLQRPEIRLEYKTVIILYKSLISELEWVLK